jgi:DNA polymerase III subunit beta
MWDLWITLTQLCTFFPQAIWAASLDSPYLCTVSTAPTTTTTLYKYNYDTKHRFPNHSPQGGLTLKLRISKSTLVEAVSQIAKAVSQRSTIPILTGMKVSADEAGITLVGNNAEVIIQVFIPCRKEDVDQVYVEKTGQNVLPGRIFSDIVRKLPGNEVEWMVNDRWQTLIRSEQAEFQLSGFDPEEYPPLPHLTTEKTFSISTDALRFLIRQTGFAVAANETRGVFTGVLMQLEQGILTCVATDSHRLSKQQITVEGSEELAFHNIIVPGKSLAELAKTFHDYNGYVDVIIGGNQMLVQTEEVKFYTRLLDGIYPDTNRVIPEGWHTNVVALTKELLQSVDRASLISRDERDNVIKWIVEDGKVEVHSVAQDIGSVTEEVKAKVTGSALTISFNARYMIEALRAIESEEICIQFTGPTTPFLIKPVAREDSLHLIVPIRTR